MPVTLQLVNAPDTRFLRLRLRGLLRLLGITRGNWCITFVRDREMKRLHARTMNDPSTTDVLTFDLRDPAVENHKRTKMEKNSSRSPLDLDTVICMDEARRRARELRHPLKHELLLYAIHSLLHVQGHDDLTPGDAQKMHRREDQLLVALGIGPVYREDVESSANPASDAPGRSGKSRISRIKSPPAKVPRGRP